MRTALGSRPGRLFLGLLGLGLCCILALPWVLPVEVPDRPQPARNPADLKRLEQAARSGVPAAMVALGRLRFELGDELRARHWFQRAADTRDGDGLYHLGLLDSSRSRDLWTAAALKGHGPAAWRLGDAWQRGLGGPADPDSARRWFQQAAAGGVVEARASLGFLLLDHGTAGASDSLAAQGWLRSAADGGEPRARQWWAGLRLARGTHRDSLAALADLRRLALAGHDPARIRLAGLLLEGPLAWRQEREGAFWLRLAAEAGDTRAFHGWARCLEWGRGVMAQPWAARRWYRRAAEAGDGLAAQRLGRMFREGRGGPANRTQALAWFVRAQHLGQISALEELGRHFEHGARPGDARWLAARAWYRQGANLGVPACQLSLSRMLRQPGATPLDHEQAHRLLEQSAAAGFTPARLELARRLRQGQDLPRDPERAWALFQQAIDEGSREALVASAGMLLRGEGVPRDRHQAFTRLQLAAGRGLGEAWLHLGRCYQLGWGTPADFEQAEHCFQLARQQGIPLTDATLLAIP